MAAHKLQRRLLLSRPALRSTQPGSRSRSCVSAASSAAPRSLPSRARALSTPRPAPTPFTPLSARFVSSYDYGFSQPDGNGARAAPPSDRPAPGPPRNPAPPTSGTASMARMLGSQLDAVNRRAYERPQRPAVAAAAAPSALTGAAPSWEAWQPAPTAAAAAKAELSVAWARSVPEGAGADPEATIVHGLSNRRLYRAGDVYTPYDLEPRARDARRAPPRAPTRDVFDVLGLDPIESYKVRA